MEKVKEGNLFKILLSLEKEGWDILEIDQHKDSWYAVAIKNKEGLYIEFSKDYKVTIGLEHECAKCHAPESENCNCNCDFAIKKKISNDFWIYKQNNN